MAFWTVIASVAAGLIVIIAIDWATNGLVQTLFTNLVQLFRQIGQVVFDYLPKPLRILIIVLLLGSVAGLIYSYTVGIDKICYNGKVVQVPFDEGLGFKFVSPDQLVAPSSQASKDKAVIDATTNQTAVFNDAKKFNLVYPIEKNMFGGSWKWNMVPTGYEDTIYNASYGLQVIQVKYNYPIPNTNTVIDRGVWVLTSYGDMNRNFGADSYTKNEEDVWASWTGLFSSQTHYEMAYEVCYDQESQTCAIQRSCSSGQIGDWLDNDNNLYRDRVGLIQYGYDPAVRQMSVAVTPYTGWHGTGIGPGPQLSDCKALDQSAITALSAADPIQYNRVYRHMFLDKNNNVLQPKTIGMYSCSNTFGCNIKNQDAKWIPAVNFYGTGFGLVMHGDSNSSKDGVVFTNGTVELPSQVGTRANLTYTELRDILVTAKPLPQGKYDIVKYYCVDKTDPSYPWGTKMLVAGIDVFNKYTLMFMIAIGLLVSFIAWISR